MPVVLGGLALSACQSEPAWQRDLAALKEDEIGVAATAEPDAGAEPTDWESLGDCRAQLLHLLRLDAEGARLEPEDLPFALIVGAPLDRVRFAPPAVPIEIDLPIAVNPPAASQRSCVIRLAAPDTVEAKRRILGQEAVASEYQSGTRREDNPAYELAKLRAREAERTFKQASGDGWSEVGDPMLDLVGLLVGSVIGGFREAGSEREMNDALMELAKTPRKIDRPVWTAYHFERLVIDGTKRAELPVELVDRAGGPEVRTTIRQTEQRRFYIPRGLHERDRDYLNHRAQSITREDLDAWQRLPPEVALSDVVAALRDHRTTAATDGAGGSEVGAESGPFLRPAQGDGDAIDAWAAAPPESVLRPMAAGFGRAGTTYPLRRDEVADGLSALDRLRAAEHGPVHPAPGRRAMTPSHWQIADPDADPRFRSVVAIRGPGGDGSGFYVAERLVVSNRHAVGETGMVDVIGLDGTRFPGMVLAVDATRNLVLIHVPRAGHPARLYDGPGPRPGQEVEAIGTSHGGGVALSRGIVRRVSDRGMRAVGHVEADLGMAPGQSGGPLFLGEEVVGVSDRTDGGGREGLGVAVHVDELRTFLEEHRDRSVAHR